MHIDIYLSVMWDHVFSGACYPNVNVALFERCILVQEID